MPTALTGFNNAGFTSNEAQRDVVQYLFKVAPDITPMLSLYLALMHSQAKDFKKIIITQKAKPTQVVVGAAVAAAASSMVVIDANVAKTLTKRTVLRNPETTELIYVTATPTTTTVAITKGYGGTTDGALVAGQVLEITANAYEEIWTEPIGAAGSFDAAIMQHEELYNLQTSFRFNCRTGRLANKKSLETGGNIRDQYWEQVTYHARQMLQQTIIWGGRAEVGSGGSMVRMNGGFDYWGRTGQFYRDMGGIMTPTALKNYLGDYVDAFPDAEDYDIFCSGRVNDLFSGMMDPGLRYKPDDNVLGVSCSKIQHRGKRFNIFPMPQLNTAYTRGIFWIIDRSKVALSELDPVHSELDVLPVGVSTEIIDVLMGTLTLQIEPSRLGYVVNALS